MTFRLKGLRSSNWRSTLATVLPSLNSQAIWDREYAAGGWQTLNADDDFARYAVIFGHLLRLPGRPAVLDVGCGSGRLLELVARAPFESYFGLDISEQAIERARALGSPNAEFAVGPAESFASYRRFDAIVFNEVAYYLKRPAEVLLRYHRQLRPGGALVLSMFESFPARLAWRAIARAFEAVETTRVINAKRYAWTIRLLRPRAA